MNASPQHGSGERRPEVPPNIRWFVTSCGIGDYIIVFSPIAEYLRKWPYAIAHVAIQPSLKACCIEGWDRVEYIVSDTCPEGFTDILSTTWKELPPDYEGAPHRYAWWFLAGLSWWNKRLWYFPTREEVAAADALWGKGRPRVSLQWHGTFKDKTHSGWPDVARWFMDHGANLMGLDQYGMTNAIGPRLVGTRSIREVLAVAATADIHVGFCSGPSYAALGANVPSVILFPYDQPHEIFLPITTPNVWCHHHLGSLETIGTKEILASCNEAWSQVIAKSREEGHTGW
jgi:hypothetical protein